MHRGLPAAVELGHLLVSPWMWEVSVNIPCPPMVFLRCFLLLPSPPPVPSCWLSPSQASQLSHTQGTTHGSRNSASASVSAGCSKTSPMMPHQTLLGAQKCGLPLKPTGPGQCRPQSCQLPLSRVTSALPGPAG